jgi:hypothetical protein
MSDINWFKHPKSADRIQPFWFWNGDMEDEEVIRQIKEMSDQGVGGFFICARQGLEIPYLSDEWFQKVKVALKEAEKQGMDVWLYDEYPYPSGIAGGEVTLAHPDAKHYTLQHRVFSLEGGELCTEDLPWARLLSVKAVPVDPKTKERLWDQSRDISSSIGNYQAEPIFQKAGLTAYNQKRFFTYKTVKKIHWTAPEGLWEVHIFMEEELADFKYYGTFIDPCHKEAIQTFIELTHDRYAEEIGEYFGGIVKGMFTDETGFLGEQPWTPRLVNYFIEQNGYDIREHLHELLYGEGSNTAKVRYDYFQAIHLLLRENYHLPIREWCDKYGLEYVAEVPAVRMTTQLYSHVPGGDSAHEKLGRSLKWILDTYMMKLRNNPKMVTSLARQLGSERALIECFHSVGWSMTLQDARWMIDRMAAMGVNFYNFHAFFYTLDGLTKHDAPPSQFLQNPYWKHFRQLGDYTGRISAVMSRGQADISIAVLDPTTTFWTHMGNPLHSFGYCGREETGKERLDQLKEYWSDICQSMLLHRVDYDHLDPELLAQAEVQNGIIKIGMASYSVLVMPPMTNIESAAWEKMKLFLNQGGVVIANRLLPYEDIEGKPEVTKEILDTFDSQKGKTNAYFLQDGSAIVPKGGDSELISMLHKHAPQAATLKVEGNAKSFLLQQRRLPDESLAVFITNQEDGIHAASLAVDTARLHKSESTDTAKFVRFAKLNLETGEREQLSAEESKDGWILPLDFAPYEAHLIEITCSPVSIEGDRVNEITLGASGDPWEWKVQSQVTWDMEVEQDNLVRFDHFDLVAGKAIGRDIQVKTFIDQCADLEASPSARYDQLFGTPMVMSPDYPINCQYTTRFRIDEIPERCHLLMDRGSISGKFGITINEVEITAENFESREIYDHLNRVCEITSMLQEGENTLSIQVNVEHDWDGVVDAIYLMGPFGVSHDKLKNPVLTPLVKNSLLHRGPYSGYPYYAGTITFKRRVNLSEVPDTETFELVFSDWDKHFYECAEVRVNGKSLGVRPWTPYKWKGNRDILIKGENLIEVVVTNTLIGMLEGKYFDYESHTLKDVSGLE